VRCGRCGNDNAEANRFCGMCGAPLVAKTSAAGQSSAAASGAYAAPPRPSSVPVPQSKPIPQASPVAVASVSATPAERTQTVRLPTESHSGPAITGPSFLGLSTPSTGGGSGGHRDHHDPLQPSSGNLDYLLEDEEEHRSGPGKLIFIVIALALAAGFGYLHWKSGGFDWLNGGDKKAAVTGSTPESSQNTSDSSTSPAAATAQPPSANSPVTPIPTDGPAANPADSTAAHTTSSQAAPPQAAPPAIPKDSSEVPDSATASSAPDAKQSDEEEAPPAAKPIPRKPAVAKQSAARSYAAKPSAGARPYDSVTEAERYIYGRGVSQDCDHGLRLLKPSAEQANPKAMISLGALYSTGTCTPRDLPTAYRWFAMALHKDPDNQALQNNLQKLWSQMTPPERQLAIKLSQ
jgi:hypothetical protein